MGLLGWLRDNRHMGPGSLGELRRDPGAVRASPRNQPLDLPRRDHILAPNSGSGTPWDEEGLGLAWKPADISLMSWGAGGVCIPSTQGGHGLQGLGLQESCSSSPLLSMSELNPGRAHRSLGRGSSTHPSERSKPLSSSLLSASWARWTWGLQILATSFEDSRILWSPVFGVSVQLPFPEGGPLKLALCDLTSLARAGWTRQTPDSCEPIRSCPQDWAL